MRRSRTLIYDPDYAGDYLVVVTVAGVGRQLYARCYGPEAWDDACRLREAAIAAKYLDAEVIREGNVRETQEAGRGSEAGEAVAA